MFKTHTGAKDERKKEKDLKKVEKNDKKEKEKEDRKRSGTAVPNAAKTKADQPERVNEQTRSLSGSNLKEMSSPRGGTPPPTSPAPSSSSPAPSPLAASVDNMSLERVESNETVPATSERLPTPTSSPPPPLNSYPSAPSLVVELPKSSSKGLSGDHTGLLKSKISALPADTKQLVEYLLNIFSRTLPPGWNLPSNIEAPSLDTQIDTTIDKLVEASEILFNKDTNSMLKRYGKELRDSPHRRTDKWKILTNLISDESSDFVRQFLSSNVLEAVVASALAKALEPEEADVLSELFRVSLIKDIAHKELLAVVQTASHSNAHISQPLEENRSLSDAIVELVLSFKRLLPNPDEEIVIQDLSTKKDVEVSEAVNQSIALLQHANTIRHAKSGNDIIKPLEHFFQNQIRDEVKQGENLQAQSEQAKVEKANRLREIDDFVKGEETKLQGVQGEITDLETKLEQKRQEEKLLKETLAKKLTDREQYQQQREQVESDIKARIEETSLFLDHHRKSEESVIKFDQDVSMILDREVNETLKKTKEVLQELDKEVSFLEDKMATYDRSISLFNAADEPEVLDGLRKLFARSTAIFSESKQSISRVSGVVELLHSVLGKSSAQVEELGASLDKIIARQNTLNNKYKLQKD